MFWCFFLSHLSENIVLAVSLIYNLSAWPHSFTEFIFSVPLIQDGQLSVTGKGVHL